MTKLVEPSIRERAFSCPHCGAFTTQYWFKLYAREIEGDNPTPLIPTEATKQKLTSEPQIPAKGKDSLLTLFNKMLSGHVVVEEEYESVRATTAFNLNLSICYNCKKISVWVHDRMVFPRHKLGIEPNCDLPEEIISDFQEAREIADASPRGAAALLRLCIQKLCKHMGEKGKDINENIAALVQKGLNPLVQQSLDVVRVVGNEAVHPGVIDISDDRETAIRLFELVNAICDQMISHPKFVKEMYEKLPEEKRKAIEKRDSLK